jgi:hypothetical protein
MTFRAMKSVTAALMLLAPFGAALVAQPAAAQHYNYRVAAAEDARIMGMSLNSDSGLRPGATLRLQVRATPGARWMSATLSEDGERVRLVERGPGEYVGSYIIRQGERIDPTRRINVRGGWGEGPVTVSFTYPTAFQALAMDSAPGRLVIGSFVTSPLERLDQGDVVHFRLEGTPGARAVVRIPEVGAIPLREVRPGVYVARHIIRDDDEADAIRDARAILRDGDQRVTAEIGGRVERYSGGYGR